MSDRALLLGVDGGGSKTLATLATVDGFQLDVLGQGWSGPGNPRSAGFDAALANIEVAIGRAYSAAGIHRTTAHACCLALAGAGRSADQQAILDWATTGGLAGRIKVTSDAMAVLAAASADWGVVLICGTGSLAWGCNAGGASARAGGWGYLLGDQGSAYWIATKGMQAAAEAIDRGESSALAQRLLERLKAASAEQLLDRVYHPEMSQDRIAALADCVFAASLLDPRAAAIVAGGAAALAEIVSNVARQLNFAASSYPLCLAGSVVLGQPKYRDAVLERLHDMECAPARSICVEEPVLGALAIARSLLAG